MRQHAFEQQQQALWQALEHDLQAFSQRESAPDADFPKRYRQVCQHLALARQRGYSPSLCAYLEQLCQQAQQQLYQPPKPQRYAWQLYYQLGQQIHAQWRVIALAALLFYGPLLLLLIGIQYAPDWAYSVLSPEQIRSFEHMYDPQAEHWGKYRDAEDEFSMFALYVWNNIGIAFRCFATGLLFGLGSLFFLIYNGVVIGAVAGHLTAIGSGIPFWSFVVGHSALELNAIVLSGACGLQLGWSLLYPGELRRLQALQGAAQRCLPLIYGMVLWLLLAAGIEAFWSGKSHIPLPLKLMVGLGSWVLLGLYVYSTRRAATERT